MGILDEAIREHLELKRQHGADDSELKQLEDDAFGPPQRPGVAQDAPDPASEAATEFMAQPDLSGDDEVEGAEQPHEPPAARREPVADVQEAPERGEEKSEAEPEVEDEEPADEEHPAAEHEAVTSPAASHSTEERHAIADQPTEMFDVEKEFASAPDAADPSDEELVAEEIAEPRLAPAEPLEALAADEGDGEVEIRAADDDDEDFFDEQRLSDELDQALEAPLEPESEEVPRPASEDSESEEMEHEGPDEGEEPEADSEELERPAARGRDEDVLEETPDFLEEAPEDDQLWFEQKPPKDFDFDD